MTCFVGIDIGTSGVRAIAIDAAGGVRGQGAAPMPAPRTDGAARRQNPEVWWQATRAALETLFAQVPAASVEAIAVDGTSGTVLSTDAQGRPLSEGWMYNDAACEAEAARIATAAPADCAAHGATSPLARMLRLQQQTPQAAHLLHQADWVAGRLCGRFGWSDANNTLKLGYDVVGDSWPAWMDSLGVRRDWLPAVVRPGRAVQRVAAGCARQFGLGPHTWIVAGSTDGVSAFLATGASEVGDAVTSLGSTLVVKLVTERPLFSARYGVYSHRIGNRWLAGGASNSGGAALLRFFSQAQLDTLTPALRPGQPTGLAYHPLPGRGERFPVPDPQLVFEPDPRPADDAVFLQALLEGITGVERLAYQRLAELGAGPVRSLRSVGGGMRNPAWRQIRQRLLGVPMRDALNAEAAYGTALLARQRRTDNEPRLT